MISTLENTAIIIVIELHCSCGKYEPNKKVFCFVHSSWISFGSNNVDIYVSYLYHTDIISRAFWMKRMFIMSSQCRYSTLNRWEDKSSFVVHILTNILHNYKCVGAACWEDIKVTGISVCLSESLIHTANGLSLVALMCSLREGIC